MTTQTQDTADVLRFEARKSRREFARSTMGRFARAMFEAIGDYLKARDQGVPREDCIRGLESVIRDVWPVRPMQFQPCGDCGDTGYRERTCMHRVRCGRYNCSIAEPVWEHRYVVPCDCQHGDKFRVKAAPSGEDQLANVGRTRKKPASNWRQIGR